MIGNYEEIKIAQAAGMLTIEKPAVEIREPVPISPAEARLIITQKRFSPITGQEIDPITQTIFKRDLDRERESLLNQKSSIDSRIATIDELLSQFTGTSNPDMAIDEKLY